MEKQWLDGREGMEIWTEGLLPEIESDRAGYGIAVDIGTTTVVVYLYDVGEKKCLGVASGPNEQARYGLDVISRIQYCSEHEDGLQKLHETIAREINELACEVLAQAGLTTRKIAAMAATGNTTMLHLLAGLSPVSMGALPFRPLSTFGTEMRAQELGLDFPEAFCYLTPCISAFVGGDISSALLSAGFAQTKEICLLMDIGTNGEIALGNSDFIYSTSAAAGPAFEGAHITCGMAGITGAINAVRVMEGCLQIGVIGGGEAQGICGSGLLDAVAVMRRLGVIDETGRIEEGRSLVSEHDGEPVIRLTDRVWITQKDIRELQMAKAAIAAGALALLKSAEIEAAELSRVYIAGGFGSYMNIDSAKEIGLLPPDFREIVNVGNAAGTGAVMALLSNKCRGEMQRLRDNARHIELGHNPYFMEKYVEGMYL